MTPSRVALIEAHFHLRVLLRILSHYQILTSMDNVALVLIRNGGINSLRSVDQSALPGQPKYLYLLSGGILGYHRSLPYGILLANLLISQIN